MTVNFTTATEYKRLRQLEKCQELMSDVTDARKATYKLIKLRNYLNRELPDKKVEALKKERDEMLDALVRINNWCAQDLAENAYVGDASGNYEKTLHGLCDICRPHAARASRLKKYGGAYECESGERA